MLDLDYAVTNQQTVDDSLQICGAEFPKAWGKFSNKVNPRLKNRYEKGIVCTHM